ncbi:hypothetical protein PVAP13_3NG293988 [Panicum virgatum]|uniref:Uncharacterized protein n=1 Tax=Panicum virgatum TaxID=38727 RepID=A0A8T0UBH9_PANVG|nr:hypothetical protein PVAP13_3NG293988 [Panicum virgatum]
MEGEAWVHPIAHGATRVPVESFIIRTRRPYFFCKKTRPLYPPHRNVPPSSPASIPPLPAVTALHPSPLPSPRRRRPSPSWTLPPSLPMPPQHAALHPPWRAQIADLGRRRRNKAMGGGSGPAASRWIGERRIRAAASRRCSGRQIRVTAWRGGGSECWCRSDGVGGDTGVTASAQTVAGARRTEATSKHRRGRAGTPGGVHRRAATFIQGTEILGSRPPRLLSVVTHRCRPLPSNGAAETTSFRTLCGPTIWPAKCKKQEAAPAERFHVLVAEHEQHAAAFEQEPLVLQAHALLVATEALPFEPLPLQLVRAGLRAICASSTSTARRRCQRRACCGSAEQLLHRHRWLARRRRPRTLPAAARLWLVVQVLRRGGAVLATPALAAPIAVACAAVMVVGAVAGVHVAVLIVVVVPVVVDGVHAVVVVVRRVGRGVLHSERGWDRLMHRLARGGRGQRRRRWQNW